MKTIEDYMNNLEFLRALVNHIMTAYLQYRDDCFGCASELWNSYPFTMLEELETLHQMRPDGEVQYNDAPEFNLQEMIRTARDWRLILKDGREG